MTGTPAELALKAFQDAAQQVPAYRELLAEAGIAPESITTMEDFARLPILDKFNTFRRFPIEQLCREGELGDLNSVLTSSGHSGVFSFGLNEARFQPMALAWLDELFDATFAVRNRKTLLINCLPMGVKVNVTLCTVAEVSVRPDMAIALVQAFQKHFDQFILIGDPGFIKHLLEMGQGMGVDWKALRVHVVLGEEPLAENCRIYIEEILGIDQSVPDSGIVTSSMGVGELGLNLFFEVPTPAPLIRLRRLLHLDAGLREAILGRCEVVPSLFTFESYRIFVEIDKDERLILTSVSPYVRLPLIRYVTGDTGVWLRLPEAVRTRLEAAGLSWDALQSTPILALHGRGKFARAGTAKIWPEAIKEGIYASSELARKITANFRVVSGDEIATVRIQLSPGVEWDPLVEAGLAEGIAKFVSAPFRVKCEPYATFGSGMTLDYERKFDYLGV